MSVPPFNALPILTYLQLPQDYAPSPHTSPIPFLTKHIRHLPPHLLTQFSSIISPRERTIITVIRNRRMMYAKSSPAPKELSFVVARGTWPMLWEGRDERRRGEEEGRDEEAWVHSGFLQGSTKHIGKLGRLLGGYEEEREAERVRTLRRETVVSEEFVPEEDESDEEEVPDAPAPEPETQEEAKSSFERRIRERFIYGLLEELDYDAIDWDDRLDTEDDREAEERWFDEDDE